MSNPSPWLVINPHGTVRSRHISLERAEAAASRLGDGYTVGRSGERARPERLGRPPVSGETRSSRMVVKCTDAELARWHAGAEREGRDLAAIVREMLSERFG